MRFSLIAATLTLALTASASQVSRRELSPSSVKCTSSLKAVSDYIPSFTRSIEKISSYTSVLDAHIKEDKLERRIRTAKKECSKVTSATEEATEAFTEIMKNLVKNIQGATDALIAKKKIIDSISLARPLLEDSLLTVYEDTTAIEDHLIDICPEKYKEEFSGYIDQVNEALDKAVNSFNVKR